MLDSAANQVIGLNDFWDDPRFGDFKGYDAATNTRYTVAVLDTGLDLGHSSFGPDLVNNRTGAPGADGIGDRILVYHVVENLVDLPASCDWDPQGNDIYDDAPDLQDQDGHGTHVTSLAAGWDSGMAPEAGIIGFRIEGSTLELREQRRKIVLDWIQANAANCNIVSVNMSYGTDFYESRDDPRLDPANPNRPPSYDSLTQLEFDNVLLAGSAGNSHLQEWGIHYPAVHRGVVAVGATYVRNEGQQVWSPGQVDSSSDVDRIVAFSQRSAESVDPLRDNLPDLYAPGALIWGAHFRDQADPDDPDRPVLIQESGTSQAAPHVAGVGVLAQQLADRYLGRRLKVNDEIVNGEFRRGFRSLLQLSGDEIFDGDDEDDTVANVTGVPFARLNMLKLADAIVPPQVESVTIYSTFTGQSWQVPSGSGEQLRTVPIAGANQIRIKFTEDMVWEDPTDPGYLDRTDLWVQGVSAPGTTPGVVDFSYSPSTRRGIWTFDDNANRNDVPLIAGQFEISLSDTVTDQYGNQLNGLWINPSTLSDTGTSVFPSGTLPATVSMFRFRFTLLPGDPTRDNVVSLDDLNTLYNNFGAITTAWTQGEMTGDGVVNFDDANMVRNRFGVNLTVWPGGGGAQAVAAGPSVSIQSSGPVGEEGFLFALAQLYATERKEGGQRGHDLFWSLVAADEQLWNDLMIQVGLN